MTRTCPHCGYKQEDYEEPAVDGAIQCRKCRETLATVNKSKRVIIVKTKRLRIPAEY